MNEFAVTYLRLSKEDDREGESGSIINQRKIIEDYCSRHHIVIMNEFVDDDYSGGNFNRPGFKAMIAFLESNRSVRLVLTKDLSRLGRDMAESSFYAERYFPEHDIQYIAIDDSFDSEKENVLAPFQFAMNDMYIRDSSKKVRNALHIMMDRGEYCFRAPYGYKKDIDDIHHLVPDENTAPVVRDIFDLAARGFSCGAIANVLTDQGVDPPLKYRVENLEGARSGNSRFAADAWNQTTIRRILVNPVYLGDTVLGKSKKVSVKSSKKKQLPESAWRVTENTHEPLVDRETRDIALHSMSVRSSDYKQYEHVRKSIFGGVLYCATCGAAMCSSGTVYNGERDKYWYLSCQNIPSRSKHKCPDGARIKYDTLCRVVSEDLRSLLLLTPEQKQRIVDQAVKQEEADSGRNELVLRITSDKARLTSINGIVDKIYEDMYTGMIPRQRAMTMIQNYERETETLNKRIADMSAELSKSRDTRAAYKRFFDMAERITNFEKLDRETLLRFVERIDVGPRRYIDGEKHGARTKVPFEQDIKIIYRFIGQPIPTE